MKKQSFLDAKAADVIYEVGRRCEWWPFDTRADFDAFLERCPPNLRGRGTHLVVGLDQRQGFMVRECEGITDAADMTQDAFVLSYSRLNERMIDAYVE